MCGQKAEYLQRSRFRKDLEPYYDWSGDESRTLTCLMRYTGSKPLTTPLAATVDTSLKTYDQLNTGECIDEWEETEPFTATISCKAAPLPGVREVHADHGRFLLEYGGYPGEDALERRRAAAATNAPTSSSATASPNKTSN